MGFTFDDTDTSGVASPLSLMHELIAKDPRNAERIFPYIGGEEVNDSPTHAHHRYVINFGEMTEEEARQWPDLMQIVEEKVQGNTSSSTAIVTGILIGSRPFTMNLMVTPIWSRTSIGGPLTSCGRKDVSG